MGLSPQVAVTLRHSPPARTPQGPAPGVGNPRAALPPPIKQIIYKIQIPQMPPRDSFRLKSGKGLSQLPPPPRSLLLLCG